jgi:hypothetical protein
MKDEVRRMNSRTTQCFHPSSFLLQPFSGAGDETRTRDPQLGRLMLYQLSYTRPEHIADCQFSIANYRLASGLKFNRQLAIKNRQ